ncbi:TEA/ATTS domain family-domain-containing protein, partial [Blakeslea trispora]
QQVWPPDVETAFIEALETIPKLGRRKILVNGKPCGRNELISDFIYRKTSKIRTRKQVSSHIQVLKNTRKSDLHFMRLLTDSVEDEGFASSSSLIKKSKQLMSRRQSNLQLRQHQSQINPIMRSSESFSSDDSSISSSSSPADYVVDFIGHEQQMASLSMHDSIYESMFNMDSSLANSHHHSFASSLSLSSNTSSLNLSGSTSSSHSYIDPSIHPLWPTYICLYLDHSNPYEQAVPVPHTLAILPDCTPCRIPSIDAPFVAKNKCPPVELNLDMNLNDFAFNNASFFETHERRTIECNTTIYSFGKVVLESKEVQQALWINEGKFVYNFAYVNQFFDAFMKGIRSLQSWEEIDIAINNLCVVQESLVTDDLMLSAATSAVHLFMPDIAPLLVMVYEFERGQGSIGVSMVKNHSKGFDFLTSNAPNVSNGTTDM